MFSVLNDNFSNKSDIDFLITFQENIEPLEKGDFGGRCTTL
jgi:predicted nucleotidyltransferase